MQATRPQGYAVLVGGGRPVEFDTQTCAHCQRLVFVKKDPGGFCRMCMKPVCGPCADEGSCRPFLKRIEEYERAAAKGRALDRIFAGGK